MELQRLADIMTQIAPKTDNSGFDGWQFFAGVLTGVIVNVFIEFVRRWIDRRAVLRISRASLYKNLSNYFGLLQIMRELGKIQAKDGQRDQTRLESRLDIVWENIRDNLVSANDRKYSLLVADAVLTDKDELEQIKALNQILREIERHDLPLVRKREVEREKAINRDMMRDHPTKD